MLRVLSGGDEVRSLVSWRFPGHNPTCHIGDLSPFSLFKWRAVCPNAKQEAGPNIPSLPSPYHSLAPTRREKSRVKCKSAHQFYARTTRRGNAAGVSCYVYCDFLCSMHNKLSCPKCTNRLAKISRIGWIHSNAALR